MHNVLWNSQPVEVWAEKYASGKFIELAGRRCHYRQAGSGPPVILLHGFFYDAFTWHNNIDALAQRFTVYAPDWWGFGYSDRPDVVHDYPIFAEQLTQFMDALAIRRAALVGHSMGGGTAIYFTVRQPERVERLLLVDAAAMPNPYPWLGKLNVLPLVGEIMFGLPGYVTRRLALKQNWIYDAAYLTDEYVAEVVRFHKIKETTGVLLGILRRQIFDKLLDDVKALGEVAVPKLLVWGRHDTAVPLIRGQEMQALLPGTRLEVFEDMAHCPHDEAAAQFNPLALDFLSGGAH